METCFTMLGTHIIYMFMFMLKLYSQKQPLSDNLDIYTTMSKSSVENLYISMKIQSIAKSSRAEISYEMFIHMYRLQGLLYSLKKFACCTHVYESSSYTVYVLVL